MQQPFKKLKLHRPSLPSVCATPMPERSVVVAGPDRLPINRQAALAIRQKRCWIEEPPIEKPKTISISELQKSQADLKIERNKMAKLSDDLGVARASVASLKGQLGRANLEISRLRQELRELNGIVKQLEDLKL